MYLALLVATLESGATMSSSNIGGSPLFLVNIRKSALVQAEVSPRDNFIACSSDGSASVTGTDGGLLKAGSGECLPEMSGSGLPVAATRHRDDPRVQGSCVPVENFTVTKLTQRIKL